jgi:hypothetical protein
VRHTRGVNHRTYRWNGEHVAEGAIEKGNESLEVHVEPHIVRKTGSVLSLPEDPDPALNAYLLLRPPGGMLILLPTNDRSVEPSDSAQVASEKRWTRGEKDELPSLGLQPTRWDRRANQLDTVSESVLRPCRGLREAHR